MPGGGVSRQPPGRRPDVRALPERAGAERVAVPRLGAGRDTEPRLGAGRALEPRLGAARGVDRAPEPRLGVARAGVDRAAGGRDVARGFDALGVERALGVRVGRDVVARGTRLGGVTPRWVAPARGVERTVPPERGAARSGVRVGFDRALGARLPVRSDPRARSVGRRVSAPRSEARGAALGRARLETLLSLAPEPRGAA